MLLGKGRFVMKGISAGGQSEVAAAPKQTLWFFLNAAKQNEETTVELLKQKLASGELSGEVLESV